MPAADKLVVVALLALPLLLDLLFIWTPAVSSVVLSFTRWNGIGGLHTRACSPPPAPSILQNGCWYGVQNYHQAATIYPPFWPAVLHNVIWLAVFLLIATPLGMLFAVLIGTGFGVLVAHQHVQAGETAIWGVVYGMFWWFLGPLTLLPILAERHNVRCDVHLPVQLRRHDG